MARSHRPRPAQTAGAQSGERTDADTGDATLGDRTVPLAPGSALYVPQGTWHGGRNTGSETMLWVAIYSPSGFENYFREIGRGALDGPPRMLSAEERRERDAKYGIRYR